MSNSYFQFRQFTLHQDLCAMKVGTDGVLLGSWAHGGRRILDIGTGTGLLALMMAQRFPEAEIVGLDIDHDAVLQARENVASSPFRNIVILEEDIIKHKESTIYDTIICNPPFFVGALKSPDKQRSIARHADTLSYTALMAAAWRLLSEEGFFSVVIPFDCRSALESEASLVGFFKTRECAVRSTPAKQPRRYLLEFRKHSTPLETSEGIIEMMPRVRSEWYQSLTNEFYL